MTQIHRSIKNFFRWLKFFKRVNALLLKELFTSRPGGAPERASDFAKYRWMVKFQQMFSDQANSPFYSYHIYAELSQLLRECGHTPKRVLEMGTGSSLGTLFCFRAGGAEAATGIDIQPIDKNQTEFYEILKAFAATVAGWKWWRYSSAIEKRPNVSYPGSFDGIDVPQVLQSIQYVSPVSSDNLPFADDSFDFIYSTAAMEHFDHIDRVVAEIRRTCVNGGITIHEVDLSHHGSQDTIGFLKLDDAEYERVACRYGDGKGIDKILKGEWKDEVYCNRLRMSDFLDIFRKEGFELLKVEPFRVLDPASIRKETLAPKFQEKSLEDLSVLGFRVVARNVK